MAKIVFTAGIMDLMHRGHINLLEKMRDEGDYVVVVLHDDASCYQIKGKTPIQTLEHRIRNLEISGLVDQVLVTNSVDPADQFGLIIGSYPDDELLFMRGDDNKQFPGRWLIDKTKTQIKFVEYTKGVSSTKLRKELWT